MEQVWQGDYGQAKPLLFFLDPAFMCPRRRGAERVEGDLAMSLKGLRKVFKTKVAVDGIETRLLIRLLSIFFVIDVDLEAGHGPI